MIKVLENKQDTLNLNFPIVFSIKTDNDFFCIICVLQENLDFLSVLSIQNLEFSPITLNLLTKLFKVTSFLKKLSITNSNFPSTDSFCLLCNALQNNSSVISLNLSSNSLSDSYGMYICDLITNSSYIKEVVLDDNLFEATDFGQCFSVSNVESVSLNGNPLNLSAIASILASSKVNLNMRHLSLKGIKNSLSLEECVAETLEYNRLVYLGFDLTEKNLVALKKIENVLIFHNRTLVMINSRFIDWDKVGERDPCFGIKKALLANMWFYNEDMKNSVIGQELFKDVQFIILKKMKNLAQHDNQRELAGTPDFKDNTGKSSFSSLLYSDSSFIDTRDKGELQIGEKSKFDMLADVAETLNMKYDKFIEHVSGSMENLNEKVERLDNNFQEVEGYISYLQGQENRNEERLIGIVHEMIEGAKQDILIQISGMIENLGSKAQPSTMNSSFQSSQLKEIVSETEEKIQLLDLKLEKQYYHIKSTFKNLNTTYSTNTQFKNLDSQVQKLSQAFEELSEKTENTIQYCQKLSENSNNLLKIIQNLQKQYNETDKSIKEYVSSISVMEEKVNNTLKIRELLKSRDEEIYKKLYNVECDILELKNTEKFEEIQRALQKIHQKLDQAEETLTKNQENNLFQLTEQNLLISEVQQKLSIIESSAQQVQSKDHLPIKEESFELSVSELHSINPEKLSYSNSLINRLEKLEKMNIHKKALEVSKTFEEEFDFVPGETENLVRSAVIERVSKLSNKSNVGLYRTLAPITPKNYYSSFEEDLQPSLELRESLKHKGLFFNHS